MIWLKYEREQQWAKNRALGDSILHIGSSTQKYQRIFPEYGIAARVQMFHKGHKVHYKVNLYFKTQCNGRGLYIPS